MSISLFSADPFFHDANSLFEFGLTPRSVLRRNEDNQPDVFSPRVDVYDTGKEIKVHAELPGIPKDKVKADIDRHGNLVIEGESTFNQEFKDYSCHTRERRYGRFLRTIGMPQNADVKNIKATFKDGVLDITVPRSNDTNKHNIAIE